MIGMIPTAKFHIQIASFDFFLIGFVVARNPCNLPQELKQSGATSSQDFCSLRNAHCPRSDGHLVMKLNLWRIFKHLMLELVDVRLEPLFLLGEIGRKT